MNTKKWEKEKYNIVYKNVLASLKMRKKNNPEFSLDRIKGELNTLYIQQENNWVGRGPSEQITISATIAAFEHFIYNLNSSL